MLLFWLLCFHRFMQLTTIYVHFVFLWASPLPQTSPLLTLACNYGKPLPYPYLTGIMQDFDHTWLQPSALLCYNSCIYYLNSLILCFIQLRLVLLYDWSDMKSVSNQNETAKPCFIHFYLQKFHSLPLFPAICCNPCNSFVVPVSVGLKDGQSWGVL